MKNKIFSLISAIILIPIMSANAEIGFGISGGAHMFKADGHEITRTNGQVNTGDHDETVVGVPEIFIEAISDEGVAFGISYIPTRDVGSKSRVDQATAVAGRDSGTYTAKAELDNVFKFYTDLPTGSSPFGADLYVHLGIQHVTLLTLETLNGGSTYPDADLFGASIGLGVKGDLPISNMYYKGEATYTNFETYKSGSTAGNRVEAELEDIAARLSIGYKF
jgi:hypothetical protein